MLAFVGPLLKFNVTGLSETGSVDGAAGAGRKAEASTSSGTNIKYELTGVEK